MEEIVIPKEETKLQVADTAGTAIQAVDFIAKQREYFAIAKTMCTAEIIPANFRNKPADMAIALEMADRMGVSVLMVTQNLSVIKGKPSWNGQACMSFIRNKYNDVEVVYTGTRGTDTRGCYIKAVDKKGRVIEGVEVTMAMAKAEGWTNNTKWKTMPELMLSYRAGAFFARIHCPEVLMGCAVEGEAEDSVAPRAAVKDVL